MSESLIRMPAPIYSNLPLFSLPPSLASTAASNSSAPGSQVDLEPGLAAARLNLDVLDPPVHPRGRAPIVGVKWPLVLGAASSGGKLIAAIGASAAVRAKYTDTITDKVVSATLLAVGLGTAIVAALRFGADVQAQAPRRVAWGLKAISIGAAFTLAAGAAMRQVAESQRRAQLTWIGFMITFIGYALVSISLPNFFAYSEARRGLALIRGRDCIRQGMAASGFAGGLAWAADIGPKESQPPYLGAAVLTLTATGLLLSLGLATSDARRSPRPLRLTT